MSEIDNSTTLFVPTQNTTEQSVATWSVGLTGTILTIFLVIITSSIIGSYIIYRALKKRRRKHGEYRPQFEEYQQAKNLPYLQPPSIEGLI